MKLSYFHLSNGYEVNRMKLQYKTEIPMQKIERWQYEESETFHLKEKYKKRILMINDNYEQRLKLRFGLRSYKYTCQNCLEQGHTLKTC